jgi:cytochrome c oxidase assembly factor CtaG
VSRRLALVPIALAATKVHAHGSVVIEAAPGWTFDAWVVVPLALAASCFALGHRRIAQRARVRAALTARARWFWSGYTVLAAALVSPLHAAGERSFAAHMLEHELLMLVAAPMLVLARPLGILLWGIPRRTRRTLSVLGRGAAGRWWCGLADPVVATTLQAAALWLWHAPALFDLALARDGWHIAQHASFVATALLFWTAVLDARRLEHRTGIAIGCLFTTAIVSGALGAAMAFSASPWYEGYASLGLNAFGLTAAEDQQLAGLLMWVPGGLVHALAALVLLRRWLVDPTEVRHVAVE